MHDALRQRLMRAIESLPEDRIYQVLDYIEFLESRYGTRGQPDPGGLQRFAERLEDRIRARSTLTPSNLREAFQLISAADRVLSSVSNAGRQLIRELEPESVSDGPPPRGARGPSSAPATVRDPSASGPPDPPARPDPYPPPRDGPGRTDHGRGAGDGEGPDPGLTPPMTDG